MTLNECQCSSVFAQHVNKHNGWKGDDMSVLCCKKRPSHPQSHGPVCLQDVYNMVNSVVFKCLVLKLKDLHPPAHTHTHTHAPVVMQVLRYYLTVLSAEHRAFINLSFTSHPHTFTLAQLCFFFFFFFSPGNAVCRRVRACVYSYPHSDNIVLLPGGRGS